MKYRGALFAISSLLLMCISAKADNGARIVRIPAPIMPRCINAKTDEVTITLRYIKTQKRSGFFTQDNRAGVTVIATLNADANTKAQQPSVNLVDIQDAAAGQVYLPLEYSIASLLPLSSDSGKTFTKNIALTVYLDRARGPNTFGDILDLAGGVLAKLPIPANPYTTAVSQVINFATTEIQKESADKGGQEFANIQMQLDDRDQPNIQQCIADGYESTGVIGVIGATGAQGATLLPLGRLSSDYCFRYVADTTYEIQYARRPASGCTAVSSGAFKDVPNDYLMVVVAANKLAPTPQLLDLRTRDIDESKKLCTALKLSPELCGVRDGNE